MLQQQTVSLDDARRVIAAGEAKAREIGSPSNIAVVDAGGNLVAQMAQPGKPFYGIQISNHERIMVFAGGMPLRSGDQIVGAVGVSGGTGVQDQTVVEAAAAGL